jgi:hypothetical protein
MSALARFKRAAAAVATSPPPPSPPTTNNPQPPQNSNTPFPTPPSLATPLSALSLVFARLAGRELFRCAQVCRLWRDTALGEGVLRERLRLRAAPAELAHLSPGAERWPAFYRLLRSARARYGGRPPRLEEGFDRTVGHPTPIVAAAMRGSRMATVAKADAHVILWNLDTGAVVRRFRGDSTPVAVHLDEWSVIVALEDGGVRVHNVGTGKTQSTFYAHKAKVTCVQVLAKGLFASGGRDGLVQLYRSERLDQVGALAGHAEAVTVVRALGDDFCVTGSEDATLRVHDIADPAKPRLLHTLVGHTDAVTEAACCAKGSHIASCSSDRTVRVWGLGEGAAVCLRVLQCPSVPLAVHLDLAALAVAYQSGAMHVHCRDTYEPLSEIAPFAKRAIFVHLWGSDRVVVATDAEKNHVRVARYPAATATSRGRGLTVTLSKEAQAAARAAASRPPRPATSSMKKSVSLFSLVGQLKEQKAIPAPPPQGNKPTFVRKSTSMANLTEPPQPPPPQPQPPPQPTTKLPSLPARPVVVIRRSRSDEHLEKLLAVTRPEPFVKISLPERVRAKLEGRDPDQETMRREEEQATREAARASAEASRLAQLNHQPPAATASGTQVTMAFQRPTRPPGLPGAPGVRRPPPRKRATTTLQSVPDLGMY